MYKSYMSFIIQQLLFTPKVITDWNESIPDGIFFIFLK